MSQPPKIRSVKFNAAMNIILTASNTLVGLITLPYVTRVLSVGGYGAVGFAQNAAGWFSTFCILGISIYGIRECAKARDDRELLATTVKELLILLTIFTAIVLAVFAGCIIFISRFQADSALLWIFLVNTLISSYGLEWVYQAMEQYSYITIRSTVFKLLTLVLIFVLVRHPDDFILYGLILSLATCGNNIFNIVHLHTLISFDTQLPLNLRQHIKPILSFGMVNIASSVYLMLDSVILGFLTNGNYQVGLYQLATKLKNFLGSVINAATNAAIPRLSYYLAHHETERYRNLLGNSISVVTNIGLYIVGCLLVFSDQIIVVISSEKYIQSTPALRIISFAMLFSALNSLMGFQILTPTGQESKLATANFIGVPISILANFSLDPFFGATGAATAAALTELAVFIIQFHYSKTVLIQTVQGHNMLKILFSVVIATCCGALFRLLPISSPFISLIIGLLVYSLIWILCLSVAHEQSIKLITSTILRKLHR